MQQLSALLSKPTITVGEQVKLNPSLDYLHCNILISATTRVPTSQPPALNRLYTIPAYMFIGETQCGVLEIHRGNTSVGYVRCLTKLYDFVDASIISDNKRCMAILVFFFVGCYVDAISD